MRWFLVYEGETKFEKLTKKKFIGSGGDELPREPTLANRKICSGTGTEHRFFMKSTSRGIVSKLCSST